MVFIELNGWEFGDEDDLTLYHAMIAVANREKDKQDLAELFRSMVTRK